MATQTKKPPALTKLSFELYDGRSFEFETRTYMSAGDRVAWERRFGLSFSDLMEAGRGVANAVKDAGDERPDLTGLDLGDLHEEWIQFFAWRCAAREVPDLASMSFDDFVENLSEYDMDEEAPLGPVPTEEAAPTA